MQHWMDGVVMLGEYVSHDLVTYKGQDHFRAGMS